MVVEGEFSLSGYNDDVEGKRLAQLFLASVTPDDGVTSPL